MPAKNRICLTGYRVDSISKARGHPYRDSHLNHSKGSFGMTSMLCAMLTQILIHVAQEQILGFASSAEVAGLPSFRLLIKPFSPCSLFPVILRSHESEVCILLHGKKPEKDPVLISIVIKDKTTKLNWKQSLHYTSLHTPKFSKQKRCRGSQSPSERRKKVSLD